jgi:hypothetical protein
LSIFISPSFASLKGSLGRVCARPLVLGRGEAASIPGVPLTGRDQLIGRGRRVLGRLAEPSSAAGLAALLALLIPDLAREAPAIVDMALTARSPPSPRSWIVRREGSGSNGS